MTFTLQQAKDLLEMFGGEDTEIVVERVYSKETSHSGPGLYAYLVDYPDEGSQFLGSLPAPLSQES